MRAEEIKNKLSVWCKRITSEYTGLKIRFEYSESRRVFLVSLYPDEVADIDRLSVDVMSFEDEMADLYGYDAPLFCDNEELFCLSQEAETVIGLKEMQPAYGWNIQLEDLYADKFVYNLAA